MYFWVLGVLTREVAFRRRIRIARYPNWSACFHPHARGRPLASFGVVGAGWVQSTWLRLRWVRECGVRVDCSWTCWVTYLAECFLPSLGCARYYIDTCEFVFLILSLVGTKRPYVGVAKKSMAALIIAPRFSRGITRRPLHNRVIGSLSGLGVPVVWWLSLSFSSVSCRQRQMTGRKKRMRRMPLRRRKTATR